MKLCKQCGGKVPSGRHKNDGMFCSKKCELEKNGYAKSTLYKQSYRDASEVVAFWKPQGPDPEKHLVTGHPTLIIGDTHCPLIDQRWLEQALITSAHFGAKTCIINGDLIDANQISRHMGLEFRGRATLEDDMDSAEQLMRVLCEEFDQVFYTLGNHTARLVSRMSGELSVKRLLKMIYDNEKIVVTQKTWMKLNEHTRVIHPRGYSQTRGKFSADLCQRHQCHIVTGHHHHSATSYSKDGKWQAIEVGCLADISKFGYVQNDLNNFPEMMNGFCVAFPDNTFLNFNRFTNWGVYGIRKVVP
jgi:hypothetical protein